MTVDSLGFLTVRKVAVPNRTAQIAHLHLRRMGLVGCEGFALWAGRREADTFEVLETIIPAQKAIRFEDGVCVRVEEDELFRLNMYLYECQLTLIAQLHSHPRDAFHSATDDTFPIATTSGAFSLVVPNFAVDDFQVETCAVYRLAENGAWLEVSPVESAEIIVVTDS